MSICCVKLRTHEKERARACTLPKTADSEMTQTQTQTRNLHPIKDFVEVHHGPRQSTLQAPQYSSNSPLISSVWHTHIGTHPRIIPTCVLYQSHMCPVPVPCPVLGDAGLRVHAHETASTSRERQRDGSRGGTKRQAPGERMRDTRGQRPRQRQASGIF